MFNESTVLIVFYSLLGPKDLPIVVGTAGRLAGLALGYVQLACGQVESVVQQLQARQVQKELQDTTAQLEAIRHEIRGISIVNPGLPTRTLADNLDDASARNGISHCFVLRMYQKLQPHSVAVEQAAYPGNGLCNIGKNLGYKGCFVTKWNVLADDLKGSDIVLEAILEAEKDLSLKHDYNRWEILVVKQSQELAYCFACGKIIVNMGLLRHLSTDTEIAALLAHEIAFIVARHHVEGIKLLGIRISDESLSKTMSFLLLPFKRRHEIEADYIGLMLMAGAGYDPRIAPQDGRAVRSQCKVEVYRGIALEDQAAERKARPTRKTRCKDVTMLEKFEEDELSF
ncbi:hypothetical protein Tsubulata_016615 [Turnera subulata]|uniref:Peptidase M48 domain-containing protein n=1 Tax=Turnera subulata TaxID=218843 RepID=A0A9Q0FS89_9ROSI|nr:hypothetical protein Tsubulata_016615 [Turnera subulata]